MSCASVAMILLAVGGIAATVEMRKLELRAAHMPPGVYCRCDSHAETSSCNPCAVRQQAYVCSLVDSFHAGWRIACTSPVTSRGPLPAGAIVWGSLVAMLASFCIICAVMFGNIMCAAAIVQARVLRHCCTARTKCSNLHCRG